METVVLDLGIRERVVFAGSILYTALMNTTPELQRWKVTSILCRYPALMVKKVTILIVIRVEPCKEVFCTPILSVYSE